MRTITSECYSCKNKRSVPRDTHIKCVRPDESMTGDEHGVMHGWFWYPSLFDPVWKTKLCSNFKTIELNKDAISDAVSGSKSQ